MDPNVYTQSSQPTIPQVKFKNQQLKLQGSNEIVIVLTYQQTLLF